MFDRVVSISAKFSHFKNLWIYISWEIMDDFSGLLRFLPRRVGFWCKSCSFCRRSWGFWATRTCWSAACLCRWGGRLHKLPAWSLRLQSPVKTTRWENTWTHICFRRLEENPPNCITPLCNPQQINFHKLFGMYGKCSGVTAGESRNVKKKVCGDDRGLSRQAWSGVRHEVL